MKAERTVKLGSICDIRVGHAFRSRPYRLQDGNVLVLQPKNVSKHGSISFGVDGPLRTEATVPKLLQQDEVLVVNRGRFAAAVFNLPGSESWIVSSSLLVLAVQDQTVLPEYIVSYLNSSSGQRQFQRHSEQTTVPFISGGNLGQMEIPIPSLDRQRSLVALDKVATTCARLTDRKMKLYRQILNLELMAEGQSLEGEQ